MVMVNWPEVKELSTEGSRGAGATASCMLPIMYCLYCSLALARLSISSRSDATCGATGKLPHAAASPFACRSATVSMLYSH